MTMTPDSESATAAGPSSNEKTKNTQENVDETNKTTVIMDDTTGRTPPFVRCSSDLPFVDPQQKSPAQVNQELNLNLGLPSCVNPNNTKLRRVIRFLNWLLVEWWEDYMFRAWNYIPLRWRQRLTFFLWSWYFKLHRKLLGRSTAIHEDASEEYHAITTFMWWGRLFPVSIKRMRFSLSQLTVWTKTNLQQCFIESIQHNNYRPIQSIPEVQQEHTTVQGIYVHTQHKPTDRVIFWLYGGAFLSGDVDGNAGPADIVGRTCGMDVFLPTYRLLPECTFDDMLWDVALAYHWLIHERHILPCNIIVLGISSGSGLAMRLLQHIAELERGETLTPDYIAPLYNNNNIMPSGAVLLCPFVDYTEPTGTFQEYDQHDLIVNQSVMEVGLPYFEKILGSAENRRRTSPVYRDMHGLPPLCVVVSQHEVVYDQTILLVNRAREAGVSVTLGVWKFMCHVFCFLGSFVPEGEQSMKFVCDWIQQHNNEKNGGGGGKE